MSSKEKKKMSKIAFILATIMLLVILIYIKFISGKEIYAIDEKIINQTEKVNVSNAESINLDDIIQKNTKSKSGKEEIYEKQEELEYITKYRNNNELYQGTTQVSQEGRNGIQTITMKKIYDNDGNIVKEEQVGCVVTKSSINKIIEIGTKVYVEPEKTKENTTSETLSRDIELNKPSGFSAEQFKKALTDSKDQNKIFQNNSEYFYYIEDEYNINGMFVAAIGIHESAWGTSQIAKDKHNLFGYGSYDETPYESSFEFGTYEECIETVAKSLVKYYINPSGTKIYDGETAAAWYYNGPTLKGINTRYATDPDWHTKVYSYMEMIYNRLQ